MSWAKYLHNAPFMFSMSYRLLIELTSTPTLHTKDVNPNYVCMDLNHPNNSFISFLID